MEERKGKKAEYRSSVRSRRMIRDAFASLIREKEISRITVTDIVTRADLNRATFYAHYPNVRGVTEEIENEIIGKMMDVLAAFRFKSFFRDPLPLLSKVSRYLEEDVEFYRTLICAEGSEHFLEKIKSVFSSYMLDSSDIPVSIRHSNTVEIRVAYFAGGIVDLYRQWFCGHFRCSLDDIASEVSRLLKLEADELLL